MKRRIVRILLALVLAGSLAAGAFQAYGGWRAARDQAEAFQVGGLAKKSGEPGPEVERPELLPEEAAHLAEVDLAALRAVNEDVVGWLEIPGTQLSYPLVQGADNQYYLSHSWKKEDSAAGSVFLEATNRRDLSGFHLIAYGHRMRNGTMFGSLRGYSDPEYLRAHPSIYLVDETGIRRYNIFAAHEAGVTSLVYRLDLEEGGLEEEFVRFCLDSSVVDAGVEPEAGVQILTLSTCTGRGYDSRWVVQGVLSGQYRTGP